VFTRFQATIFCRHLPRNEYFSQVPQSYDDMDDETLLLQYPESNNYLERDRAARAFEFPFEEVPQEDLQIWHFSVRREVHSSVCLYVEAPSGTLFRFLLSQSAYLTFLTRISLCLGNEPGDQLTMEDLSDHAHKFSGNIHLI
jgi:hypothetical protein